MVTREASHVSLTKRTREHTGGGVSLGGYLGNYSSSRWNASPSSPGALHSPVARCPANGGGQPSKRGLYPLYDLRRTVMSVENRGAPLTYAPHGLDAVRRPRAAYRDPPRGTSGASVRQD